MFDLSTWQLLEMIHESDDSSIRSDHKQIDLFKREIESACDELVTDNFFEKEQTEK